MSSNSSANTSSFQQTSGAMDALLSALNEMGGAGDEFSTVEVVGGSEGAASVSINTSKRGAEMEGSQQRSLESLLAMLGQQLANNRTKGNGDDWAGRPKGGGGETTSDTTESCNQQKASSSASLSIGDVSSREAKHVENDNDEPSLDDLVMKVQQQLRNGGLTAQTALASSSPRAKEKFSGGEPSSLPQTSSLTSGSTFSPLPPPPPPKAKEEYDAMSLDELVGELAKVQAAGIKLL